MHKGAFQSWIWFIFKIAFVVGIFAYLIKTGQLNPKNLKFIIESPGLFLSAILFTILGDLVNVQRLRVLLKAQGFHLDFWPAAKLTFVGIFFNSTIPGTVSGEIVKAYYLGRKQEKKTELAATIFFDRLLGMYTLVFIAALGSAISFLQYQASGQTGIWTQPALMPLGGFAPILLLFLSFIGGVFGNRRLRKTKALNMILSKMPFNEILIKIYDAVYQFAIKFRLTFYAMLLSFMAQLLLLAGIWCLLTLLKIKTVGLISFFFAVPLCLMVNSIPLTPGGLGVGEVGFQSIFLLFNSHKGAVLALLYHAVVLIISLGIGGAIYLFSDISKNRFIQPSNNNSSH